MSSKLPNLNKIKQLEAEIAFEYYFYKLIAKDEFELIPIPCEDGYELTEVEIEHIIALAIRDKISILYSIKLGNNRIICCPTSDKIGIIPEQPREFYN